MAEFSVTTTKLFDALHKFQSDVGKIVKDGKNPHFGNTYATLNQVWEGIQPVLSKHGLVVIQQPEGDCLTTIIAHKSGEYIETTAQLANIADPQKQGGSITYMRRYALAGLGLVIDEDDDANAATKAATPRAAKPRSLTGSKPKWKT